MNPANPPSDRNSPADTAIAAAAAEWLTRREEGWTPAEARAFAQWRRADPRHAAAFERVEQTHGLLERLPFAADLLADLRATTAVPPSAPVAPTIVAPAGGPRPTASRGRRSVLFAAAAIVVVALLTWWPRPAAPETLGYATTAGGYERVLLADGSTLELNANSAATVRFAADERHVTLTAGEAHFHVARDPERPFVVTAGRYAVRAVGTAFNVRFAPDAVEVLVTEGRVRVSPGAAEPSRARAVDNPAEPLLAAGQRVVIPAGAPPSAGRIENVDPATLRRSLAWQERKLQFVDTPLREVAAQFNQRNRTQLLLADVSLGERPVGGTFAADNVEAFVRLLQSSGDISVERRGEHEIVLRRAQ